MAGAGEGGQIPPEARAQFRALGAQPGGGSGGFGPGAGLARRGGVSGTIAQLGEGRATIDTDRGPVEAVLDEETLVIEVTGEGKLADLPIGARVTAVGSRDGEGSLPRRAGNDDARLRRGARRPVRRRRTRCGRLRRAVGAQGSGSPE